MILFRNNQLIMLSDVEDSKDNIKIVVSKESNTKFYVRDAEYRLKCFDDGYTFVITVSPFSDNSGIGTRMTNPKPHIGSAIKEAQRLGHDV